MFPEKSDYKICPLNLHSNGYMAIIKLLENNGSLSSFRFFRIERTYIPPGAALDK